MEIIKIVFLFNMVLVSHQSKPGVERNPRYSPHPALTMFNTGMGRISFPGFAMPPSLTGGMSSYSIECIRDDIVCPAYCLMEDEWGCKSCPCGPANGMSPARVSSHSTHAQSSESKHDCMGTILCMLTCKDGYQLGSRQENGCQTCTCKKHSESKNATANQQGGHCLGPACSAKNGMFTSIASKGQTAIKECKWPLCMNGTATGGGESSALDRDCVGPACSAVNGMRLLEQRLQRTPQTPRQPRTTPKPRTCQATEICKKTCKYNVKLGKPGPDGCPTCLCAMTNTETTQQPATHSQCHKAMSCTQSCRNGYQLGPEKEKDGCPVCRCLQVPTTPKPKTLLLIPLTPPPPTPAPCEEVTRCMRTCRYGYQIDSQKYATGCPQCKCIIPLSPPPPMTTRTPGFMSVMLTCPKTVHCMETCSNGYTLKTDSSQECPLCTCNTGPAILLLCEKPLSCPQGCTVGYKCDNLGCPTCNCIKPSETKLTVEIHTTVTQSSLTCRPNFSCAVKCDFGYKTGGDSCPTCDCLKPVTVQLSHVPVISQPMLVTQAPPLIMATQFMPLLPAKQSIPILPVQQTLPQVPPQTSGIGCLGPECSALGLKESHQHSDASSSIPSLDSIMSKCPKIAQCLDVCKNGFDIGNAKPGECPPCSCLEIATPRPVLKTTTESLPSVAEACPDTVKCMVGCNGPYNLTTTGSLCPSCSCLQKDFSCTGDTCVSIHDSKSVPSTTPSPGECLAILHCVLTCQRGYDVGDVGSDGCPSCKCLD